MPPYDDNESYYDGPMFIANDISRTPYGQAMAHANAMAQIQSVVRQYNHSNQVYPCQLVEILEKLLTEYENLCSYNRVIEDYHRHLLAYDAEQARQIQAIELRRGELKWFKTNVRDDLLHPHRHEPNPQIEKKKGFWGSLFG